MRLLATSDDLKNFLGIEKIDAGRADFVLGGVSTEVRRYTRQAFDGVKEEIEVLDGSGTSVLLLPGLPVRAVSTIVVDGVSLAETDYEWSKSGMLKRANGFVWPQKYRAVSVAYSYGYEFVPEDVRLLVVRVAARGYANPTGVTTEAMAGYSAGYGFDSSRMPTLTPADREVLYPYMGRT